jgi:hypothetical protein
MGAKRFDKNTRYRIVIGCIFVITIIATAVLVIQTQNQEVSVFSISEYNVRSYPYYFRTTFQVPEHPSLDAYLRIQMNCQGLSDIEGTWLHFRIYRGNISILDTYHDPENSTVNWLMGEDGLTLRHSAATIRTLFDEVQDFILTPGEYVWVHYITSPGNVTARMFSVALSIVYH